MGKIFKVAEGAIKIPKHKVQIYGECLDRIAQQYGSIKQEDVVEEARNPKSPIHDFFDWSDKEAAEKWRLEQAGYLIRSIKVVIKYDHQVKEQRAFFSVQTTPNEKIKNVAYVRIERALTEPELRKQIVANALAELEFWQEKYSEYKELTMVFRAINKVKKKVKSKKVKAKRKVVKRK
jgi:hypothetical protein